MSLRTATRVATWCVAITLASTLLLEVHGYFFRVPGSTFEEQFAWYRLIANFRSTVAGLMDAGILVFLIILRSKQKDSA